MWACNYKLKMMIQVYQILSFLSLLSLAAFTTCPTQYIFPTCTMDVYYRDSQCFNFDFIGCQYFGYTSSSIEYDWITCCNLCCDSNVQYLTNSDSIVLCSNYNNWQNTGNIILIALASVALVIPSLIVMIWRLVVCYKRCRNR